jgi:hypothetical protein
MDIALQHLKAGQRKRWKGSTVSTLWLGSRLHGKASITKVEANLIQLIDDTAHHEVELTTQPVCNPPLSQYRLRVRGSESSMAANTAVVSLNRREVRPSAGNKHSR